MFVPDMPAGAGYQRAVALGQPQGSHPTEPQRGPSPLSVGVPSDDYPGWLEIPAFYTVTIILGGDPTKPSAVAGEGVVLRPEPFVCRRITWATTGDCPIFVPQVAIAGSAQGRAVRVEWDDEFTKFLGTNPCLVSALMGDSNGFLDFPRRGVLLQGKQKLTVRLSRILWPSSANPADTEWDFNFQGVGLLPHHINQSGSAV